MCDRLTNGRIKCSSRADAGHLPARGCSAKRRGQATLPVPARTVYRAPPFAAPTVRGDEDRGAASIPAVSPAPRRRLAGDLDPRAEAELGQDVGYVRLHGA